MGRYNKSQNGDLEHRRLAPQSDGPVVLSRDRERSGLALTAVSASVIQEGPLSSDTGRSGEKEHKGPRPQAGDRGAAGVS